MRILLFGPDGQVGRALVATAPSAVAVERIGRDRCDITDREAVSSVIAASGAALVVNAAAYTAVDKAEDDPALAQIVNGDAPGWMAAAAASSGKRFAHISTDFVFDGAASSPYAPSHPPHPLGVYGASKREGERAAAVALPNTLIVRTAWVYASAGQNFPLTMLRLMRANGEVRVIADQIGTPTWATSLAEGLWKLIAAKASGIQHLTDAGVASWYDFAVAIAEEALALGLLPKMPIVRPIRTQDYSTRAARPAYSVLDNSHSWEIIGRPPLHWRQSLRKMLKEIDNG